MNGWLAVESWNLTLTYLILFWKTVASRAFQCLEFDNQRHCPDLYNFRGANPTRHVSHQSCSYSGPNMHLQVFIFILIFFYFFEVALNTRYLGNSNIEQFKISTKMISFGNLWCEKACCWILEFLEPQSQGSGIGQAPRVAAFKFPEASKLSGGSELRDSHLNVSDGFLAPWSMWSGDRHR